MSFIPVNFGMSSGGNTSGSSGTVSNQMVFVGGNNITLSQSTTAGSATLSISAGAGGGSNTFGMSNLGNTSGTSGTVNGTAAQYLFAGGNNVTLSQSLNGSSATITISAAAVGAGSFTAGVSTGGNTLGTTGTVANQIIFVGGNNVTLSQSANAQSATVTISAGAGGGGGATLSRFEDTAGGFTSLGAIGQGSLSVKHMYVPFNVTGTAVRIGGSLSAATNTSATTASANISLYMGIYTLNGSTLSLASSGSANNGFQWSQSASTTGNTSINSMRQMTVPMNVNMTPGEYWMGAVISSATTYTSAVYTMYGNSLINNAATAAVLTPIGSATTAARDVYLWQGIYTAATGGLPTTILNADVNNTSASNVLRANFYNLIYNATY